MAHSNTPNRPVESPRPSTNRINRSSSVPILRSLDPQPRTFGDQLLEIADKIVDTLPQNTLDRQSSVSSLASNETSFRTYYTPYCKHRHSCIEVLFLFYLYIIKYIVLSILCF